MSPSFYRVTGVYDKYQRTEVNATGASIIEVGPDYVIVIAHREHLGRLQRLGYRCEAVPHRLDFPPADSLYHNYDEMTAEIQQAAADHPGIMSVFSIGQSCDGKELTTVKISDNPDVEEGEPGAYFIGLHHAREHLTVEMVLAIMEYLTDHYGTDARVAEIVNGREVYLTFAANPDGGEYDIRNGTYEWWRKNRQPNVGFPGFVGTDINRNYSYRWGTVPGGSSGNPAEETYRGASAFSAPETGAVRDFVDAHPNIRTAITFHSYGELVQWPYGYTYEHIPSDMDPDDYDRFVEMGTHMASTNGYTPQQSSDLYLTDGTTDDWMYGVHRIFCFTFEMYPVNDSPGFYPGDEYIQAQCARNMEAVLYLCEQAGPSSPPTPTPTSTPTPTATPIPVPPAVIVPNGASFAPGDRLTAEFILNAPIGQPFAAYAVFVLADGSMVNAVTLGPVKPLVSFMPALGAPFTSTLFSGAVPAGAPKGGYEIVAAFFNPFAPVTRRGDAFMEAAARFEIK